MVERGKGMVTKQSVYQVDNPRGREGKAAILVAPPGEGVYQGGTSQPPPKEPPDLLNKPVVLVIEDEITIRRFIKPGLVRNHHKVIEAETGHEGLALASSHRPDLILLDWGLQGLAGWLVLKRLREWTRVPILILAVHSTEKEKIEALDAGADDFLTMPVEVGELLARMRAALRQSRRMDQPGNEPVFQTPDFKVDLAGRTVTAGEKGIYLTPTEYSLLAVLVRHAGKVVTQETLNKEIWGPNAAAPENCLRLYIHQLRQKLEPDPALPRYFLTEPGVGYRLKHN
jgi:two-component system KDP operon response regulator KdpE